MYPHSGSFTFEKYIPLPTPSGKLSGLPGPHDATGSFCFSAGAGTSPLVFEWFLFSFSSSEKNVRNKNRIISNVIGRVRLKWKNQLAQKPKVNNSLFEVCNCNQLVTSVIKN